MLIKLYHNELPCLIYYLFIAFGKFEKNILHPSCRILIYEGVEMKGKIVFGSSPNVHLHQLLWVGPLTILASILGVLIVRVIAVSILKPDPTPISLG